MSYDRMPSADIFAAKSRKWLNDTSAVSCATAVRYYWYEMIMFTVYLLLIGTQWWSPVVPVMYMAAINSGNTPDPRTIGYVCAYFLLKCLLRVIVAIL